MNKSGLPFIGFVLGIFSLVLFTSCGEETVAAKTMQPANLSYHEEFDSMQRVIDMGWKSINLSDPNGGDGWHQGLFEILSTKTGLASTIAAHSYKASSNEYALCQFTVGAGLSFINCWLLTPSLAMKNGDKFSFWTTTVPVVSFPDRMQVWLNPSNDGTNVGRTTNETGDFTVKLLDLNPTLSAISYPTGYPTTWTKFEFVIAGLPNGTIPQKHRIGFRYFVKDGGPGGSVSDQIGIDDFDFISQ